MTSFYTGVGCRRRDARTKAERCHFISPLTNHQIKATTASSPTPMKPSSQKLPAPVGAKEGWLKSSTSATSLSGGGMGVVETGLVGAGGSTFESIRSTSSGGMLTS